MFESLVPQACWLTSCCVARACSDHVGGAARGALGLDDRGTHATCIFAVRCRLFGDQRSWAIVRMHACGAGLLALDSWRVPSSYRPLSIYCDLLLSINCVLLNLLRSMLLSGFAHVPVFDQPRAVGGVPAAQGVHSLLPFYALVEQRCRSVLSCLPALLCLSCCADAADSDVRHRHDGHGLVRSAQAQRPAVLISPHRPTNLQFGRSLVAFESR